MKFLLGIITVFIATAAFGQHSLTVEVKGLRTQNGCLRFSVFKSETGFPEKVSFALMKGKIETLKSATASYTFQNLPTGTYAVSVYHDEDNNGEMKKNALGIPLEGTAASNDARGKLGPPKFADAKFTINADKKITVTLLYF